MQAQKILFFSSIIFYSYSYAQNHLNFGEVTQLVKEFDQPILLQRENSSILISNFQSQVISSSVNGEKGYSYGWLNNLLIQKNKKNKSTLFYGGEDRFQLNPIGSKYTLYYGQKPIQSKNWKVPSLFWKEQFKKTEQTSHTATFEKRATVVNHIGTSFSIQIRRKISLFSKEKIKDLLKIESLKFIKSVGFSSNTKITNTGTDWNTEKGLITPWTLGMFKGTESSIGIFPYTEEKNQLEIRKYLASIEKDRLFFKNGIVYFKTDGKKRSKIGLSQKNSTSVFGNYDYKNNRLTVVAYSFNNQGNYLSTEETASSPQFKGDVINSYNNDSKLGIATFFELETSAPAKVLKRNESINHIHNTFHFEGSFEALNTISIHVLGCNLIGIETVFK